MCSLRGLKDNFFSNLNKNKKCSQVCFSLDLHVDLNHNVLPENRTSVILVYYKDLLPKSKKLSAF